MTTAFDVSAYTLTNALGHGRDASADALTSGQGALRRNDFCEIETWIGRVEGLDDMRLTGRWSRFDCRNNRLAELALTQDDFEQRVARSIERYGADRIGVFLGTSTSGILETETAYRHLEGPDDQLPADFDYASTHNPYSVTAYVRGRLGLRGVAMTVSTACSSSAKVFATAARHIRVGFCDAAVVGGVDSLCLTTLYGFGSLELVDAGRCRPFDRARAGMNIGEGAGFALLERSGNSDAGVAFVGYGESTDGYHISTPDPAGVGADAAMRQALRVAAAQSGDVDYINMHGTGTWLNDAMEGQAVASLFGSDVPCSSTKGLTGHTLGAAGITEALFCVIVLERGLVPANANTSDVDETLGCRIQMSPERRAVRRAVTNSFGFGGNNCCLVFEQAR